MNPLCLVKHHSHILPLSDKSHDTLPFSCWPYHLPFCQRNCLASIEEDVNIHSIIVSNLKKVFSTILYHIIKSVKLYKRTQIYPPKFPLLHVAVSLCFTSMINTRSFCWILFPFNTTLSLPFFLFRNWYSLNERWINQKIFMSSFLSYEWLRLNQHN